MNVKRIERETIRSIVEDIFKELSGDASFTASKLMQDAAEWSKVKDRHAKLPDMNDEYMNRIDAKKRTTVWEVIKRIHKHRELLLFYLRLPRCVYEHMSSLKDTCSDDIPPGAHVATPILEEHGHPTDMENFDTDIPVVYHESPPGRPFLWQLHPTLRIAGTPVYRQVPMTISVQLRMNYSPLPGPVLPYFPSSLLASSVPSATVSSLATADVANSSDATTVTESSAQVAESSVATVVAQSTAADVAHSSTCRCLSDCYHEFTDHLSYLPNFTHFTHFILQLQHLTQSKPTILVVLSTKLSQFNPLRLGVACGLRKLN